MSQGHLYCPACRAAVARTCKLCKQAVTTEAASHQENIALERLLSLIALPCKDRYTETISTDYDASQQVSKSSM